LFKVNSKTRTVFGVFLIELKEIVDVLKNQEWLII